MCSPDRNTAIGCAWGGERQSLHRLAEFEGPVRTTDTQGVRAVDTFQQSGEQSDSQRRWSLVATLVVEAWTLLA